MGTLVARSLAGSTDIWVQYSTMPSNHEAPLDAASAAYSTAGSRGVEALRLSASDEEGFAIDLVCGDVLPMEVPQIEADARPNPRPSSGRMIVSCDTIS
jgi:hypothetical protein